MVEKIKINDHGDCIYNEQDALDILYNDPEFDISKLGINKKSAVSMASLHPAMRYNIDNEYGALGHSKRADIIQLNKYVFIFVVNKVDIIHIDNWIKTESEQEPKLNEYDLNNGKKENDSTCSFTN